MKNNLQASLKKLLLLVSLIALGQYNANAQWQTSGPFGGTIKCLAISGANIFASTQGGVFLSTNNGASWTEANTGLSNVDVISLAISGSNIFANATGSGVYLSTNNGASWTAVNTGLTNLFVNSIAASGSNVFACTNGSGVFLSTNNGASWTAVNNGLSGNSLYVYPIAVSGSDIIVATSGGLFRSTNNGASWTAVSGLPSSYPNTLAISGSNIFVGTAFDGVYLSTDNGASWTAVNTGLPAGAAVSSFAIGGSNIFAGTIGNGVYQSTNNGASWTAVSTGLTNFDINSLAISGSNIFAGVNGNGVFLSANNGASWTAVNTGLTNFDAYSLAISGSNIFAGVNGNGAFLSTNNGASWTVVNTGLTDPNVYSFAISGANIFAGTAVGGVYLSTNNGASWTEVSNNLPVFDNVGLAYFSIVSLAISGSNIFAGTNFDGVYLSTDNGASWTAVNTGLSNSNINSLAISGSNIFTGTNGGGVFLSTNNGTSWTAVNTGLTNTNVLSLAISGSNIFAGTNGGGVFLSTNNGASWTAVNTGLTNMDVLSLGIGGSNILAGTNGGGVFLSTNNGASWTADNTGLTNNIVNSIAISGTSIFAGTAVGVFGQFNCGSSAGTATSAGGDGSNPNTVICSGTTTTINLAGFTGNIQWQSSADGETGWANVSNGSGANTATYTTPPLTSAIYYRAIVSNSCFTASSNTVQVVISATPVVTLTNVTPTSVSASWAPFEANSGVVYKLTYSGAGTGTINSAASPQTINGLTPGEQLMVSVDQTFPFLCAATGSSSINTLLTAPTLTLSNPTGPVVAGFTASWSTVAGATSYTLTYKNAGGTGVYTSVTTSNTSVILSHLYAGAPYLAYVTANEIGYTGARSTEKYITTLPNTSTCATPTFSVVSNCSNQLTVTLSGGTAYRLTLARVSPSTSAGTSYNVAGGTVSVTVGSQNASSIWQVIVAANCSGVYSEIADPQYVLIKPVCPQLQNLLLTTPDCHGFEATWNADNCGGSLVGYYLYIQKQGVVGYSGYPIGTNNYVHATWLGPNTYNAYVASVSCNTSVSSPSAVQTITTGAGCRTDEEADNSLTTNAEQGNTSMNIYPNPSSGDFMVNVYTKNKPDEMMQIEMVNTLGQVVLTVIAPITNGISNNLFQVPANVASGLYIIHTVAGGENLTKQVIYNR